ncbi:MAG: hypothetical protein IJY20_06425 [Clostridia bacterium]|nr:hypothetical protein [Clostridia bacterium]
MAESREGRFAQDDTRAGVAAADIPQEDSQDDYPCSFSSCLPESVHRRCSVPQQGNESSPAL